MIWHLIEHNAENGKFNMDFDKKLAEICGEEEVYLRLYRWKPFTISLGVNQSEYDLNIEKIASDGLDLVKRPTGGRAILHADELTYSFTAPLSLGLKPNEVYNKISQALVSGLKIFHPIFENLELEELQPDFHSLLKKPSGAVCFNSTARHEVKFAGKKLIGSAQRVYANSILQHGSILVGDFHRNLVNYLNLNESTRKSLAEEMEAKTIELETILNSKVDYRLLRSSIVKGFETFFGVRFERTEFAAIPNAAF